MHNRENWDDIRFVLSVARLGSLSAAAKQLGVNHATVLRRVNAFETRHNVALFVKTVRGYSVNPEFRRVLEAISDAESAIFGVDRAISGAQAPLRGLVRVTSTDTFCATLLPGIVAEIQKDVPELHIELVSNNSHVDLSRMEADITVRPALSLPDELDGEVAASLAFATFEPVGIKVAGWLGLSGPLARSSAAKWFGANMEKDASIVATSDSFLTLQRMAEVGLGRVILPSLLGRENPRLRKIVDLPHEVAPPVWVATHKDMGHSARIRAVRDRLVKGVKGKAHLLA